MKPKGRTVVITGAASGIDLALARRAAGLGMNLMLADIRRAWTRPSRPSAAAGARPDPGRRPGPKPPSPRWRCRFRALRRRASVVQRRCGIDAAGAETSRAD